MGDRYVCNAHIRNTVYVIQHRIYIGIVFIFYVATALDVMSSCDVCTAVACIVACGASSTACTATLLDPKAHK